MAQVLVQNDAGCPEALANGTDGQVLGLVAGEPTYIDAVITDDQNATEVPYGGSIAGTPLQNATTVEDALDTLAPCLVCSVVSGADCVTGSMGADWMLRSASKSNAGVLTLNSAPEHTSRSFHSGRIPSQSCFTDAGVLAPCPLTNPGPAAFTP